MKSYENHTIFVDGPLWRNATFWSRQNSVKRVITDISMWVKDEKDVPLSRL